MIKTFRLLAIVLIICATNAFAQNTEQAGQPKSLDPDIVGAGGEFTTNLEIRLPEFRDLPLPVSLSYNSSNIARSGVDNIVAFGWRLNAFSVIERKSLGGGAPTFDDGQDVYVLDGEELMACKDFGATNPWTSFYPLRYLTDRESASCRAGGNFAPRVENFLRIVYHSATNRFSVTRPDGTQLTYQSIGELAGDSSAIGTAQRNYAMKSRWLLTEIRDLQTAPNTVTYTYSFSLIADGYAHRLTGIDFAGYSVRLEYKPSTDNNLSRFATGSSLMGKQAYRLSSIRVLDGSMPIRAYQMTITESALTKTALLSGVTEYGSDYVLSGTDITGGSTIPSTQFTYSTDQVSFETKTYPGIEFHEAMTVHDTNYDGTDELIFSPQPLKNKIVTRVGDEDVTTYQTYYTFMAGHYAFDRARNLNQLPLLTNNCKSTATGTSVPGLRFTDAVTLTENERGSSPLVCVKRQSRTHSPYSDAVVTDVTISTHNVYAAPTTRIDLLSFRSGPDPLRTRDASGNYDLDPHKEFIIGATIYDLKDGIFTADPFLNSGGAYSHLGVGTYGSDFTGDGVPDGVSGSYIRRNVAERGYLGVGGAMKTRTSYLQFSIPVSNLPPIIHQSSYYWAAPTLGDDFLGYGDLDGNGLTDFVSHKANLGGADTLIVYVANGIGLGTPLTIALPNLLSLNRAYVSNQTVRQRALEHRTVFRDVNADGLVDIVLHDGFLGYNTPADFPYRSGGAWILINNGSGFVQVPVNGSLNPFTHLIASGDFDGDGLLDIALEGQLNMKVGTTFVREDGRILFGSGGISNRMTTILDADGGLTAVSYAPSSDFGSNQMPGVQQVVKSITKDDGRGGLSETRYAYVGGAYDFINRRTLGYRTVTAYLPAVAGETTGPEIATTYLNSHIAEYGLVKSRIVTQGGVTLSREIFDYTIVKTGNGPWRADRTSERKASLFGGDLVEATLLRSFNLFGQVASGVSLGFTVNGANLDPSDDVVTTFGYNPDLSSSGSSVALPDPSADDGDAPPPILFTVNPYIVDRPTFRREEKGSAPTATLTDDLSYSAFFYDGAADHVTGRPTIGNLTKVDEWTGNTAALTLRTAKLLTYDSWGNVLTEADAKGQTTLHTYDTAKRLFRLITTNALGHLETVSWNAGCQAPATVTDPNLRITSKTYDAFCRETRTDLPGGQYLITRYVSFGSPALQHVERESRSGSTTPGLVFSISRDYFDGLGRVWAKTQPGTTSAIDDAVLQLRAYDARGNLTWTSLPLPFSSLSTIPSAAQRTSFTYDGLNRAVDTLLPDGAKRSLAYLTVSLSHFNGPTFAYPASRSLDEHCFDATAANTICGEAFQLTDAAGRLIRSDRSDTALTDLGAGGQALRSTSYRYDAKGSLIGVTDPGGINFAYTYDVYGNRLTADDPGLGFWTLTYDANNNLLTQTDAKGQLISFAYDALNRVTLKTVGTGPTRVETRFTYDQPRTGFYNKGRETTQEVWTPTGTIHRVERDWHLMGGLAVERHMIDGRSYALETSFAPNGAPLDQKLPGTPGDTTTGWIGPFTYDAAGRVTAFTGYVTGVSYNAWGQPTAAAYANGVTESYAYDPARGWLTSVTGTLPGGDMAFRAAYDRSATGRIFRADTQAMVGGTPTDAGGSYNYAYDYTGRLLAATNWRGVTGLDQVFAYDRAGRIRAKGPTLATAMTYDYADPLTPEHAPGSVTAGGVTTDFTYDANGNMLTGLRAKIMTYDGENRPLSVSHLGKRTCYVYGVDGKRLKKVEGLPPAQDCAALPANTNATVYFGAVEVRNWLVAGAEQVLTYPHPAVKLLNDTTPAVATYMHRDGLASVRAITNAAGVKIEAALYKPFGEQSEWVLPGNAAPETKGWIGERFDADAGLQYLNARYYDPELSLFLQPDWFEVTKAGVGTNRFSYSANDPVNKFDPGGNTFEAIWKAIVNAFSGGSPQDAKYLSKSDAERRTREVGKAIASDVKDKAKKAAEYADKAFKIFVLDYDKITNGSITLDGAMEVAGIVPIAKAAKYGGKIIQKIVKTVSAACSFDGSTLVLTKSGKKPIRAILPGRDRVWGLDTTGKGFWHLVTDQTVATYDHKVLVTIRDVETGTEQTITSNRIHPYFAQVPEGEVVLPASEGFTYEGPQVRGYWIDAGNLKPGYKLLNPDNTWAEVVSVLKEPATLDAWNLTVEGANSYFVAETDGAGPVWVHNACTPAKINHIFGNSKHQLSGLIDKFGDPIKAYDAVSVEANRMLLDPKTSAGIRRMANSDGILPSAGPVLSFGDGVVVQLSGGRIIDNEILIGTFSGVIRLP